MNGLREGCLERRVGTWVRPRTRRDPPKVDGADWSAHVRSRDCRGRGRGRVLVVCPIPGTTPIDIDDGIEEVSLLKEKVQQLGVGGR